MEKILVLLWLLTSVIMVYYSFFQTPNLFDITFNYTGVMVLAFSNNSFFYLASKPVIKISLLLLVILVLAYQSRVDYKYYALQGSVFHKNKSGYDAFALVFKESVEELGYTPDTLLFYPNGIVKIRKDSSALLKDTIEEKINEKKIKLFPMFSYLLGAFFVMMTVSCAIQCYYLFFY